jgi:hypothetical protein
MDLPSEVTPDRPMICSDGYVNKFPTYGAVGYVLYVTYIHTMDYDNNPPPSSLLLSHGAQYAFDIPWKLAVIHFSQSQN